MVVEEEVRSPLNLGGVRPETIADFTMRTELGRFADSIACVLLRTERDERDVTYSVVAICYPDIPYDDQPEPPEMEIWSRVVQLGHGSEYRCKVAVQDQEAIGALAYELAKFSEDDGT